MKTIKRCFVFAFAAILSACIDNDVPPERNNSPTWSPDGAFIAYACYKDGPILNGEFLNDASFDTGAAEICIMDTNGMNKRRLTRHEWKVIHTQKQSGLSKAMAHPQKG